MGVFTWLNFNSNFALSIYFMYMYFMYIFSIQATLFSPGGPALAIGVCVPNSCGNEDTAGLVNTRKY